MSLSEIIKDSAYVIAKSCDSNPVMTTTLIVLFWFMLNEAEAIVETLLFGDRFTNWLDPIFMTLLIAYSAYVVWVCYQTK